MITFFRANETVQAKKQRLDTDRERKRFTREIELREHNEMECSQNVEDDSELPSQSQLNKAWNEATISNMAETIEKMKAASSDHEENKR